MNEIIILRGSPTNGNKLSFGQLDQLDASDQCDFAALLSIGWLRIKLGDEHQEIPSCPATVGAAEVCEENETPPTPKRKTFTASI